MKLVFLLEERSMAVFLEGLLPRILPEDVVFTLVPHEGKTDCERSHSFVHFVRGLRRLIPQPEP